MSAEDKLRRAREFRRDEIVEWLRDASAILLEVEMMSTDSDLAERAGLARLHVDEARDYVVDPDEFMPYWRAMIERDERDG